MYAGAATDATPIPMPPIAWKAMNIQMLLARPAPAPQTKKDVAASFIIANRPIRSAIRPAIIAPAAAPISAAAAAKPNAALPM